MVCGGERPACSGRGTVAAAADDFGRTLILADDGAVFLVHDAAVRQVGFEVNRQGGVRRGSAGLRSEGGWAVYKWGASALQLLAPDGTPQGWTAAWPHRYFAGADLRGETFAHLIRPLAKRAGQDSVVAEIRVVEPRARRGEVLARLPVVALGHEKEGGAPLRPFFEPELRWGLADDSSVWAVTDERYRIIWISGLAATRVLEVAAPVEPVTEDDLDLAGRAFMAQMPRNAMFRRAVELDIRRRQRAAPKFFPAIADLVVADSGWILVKVSESLSNSSRWDVFDADGTMRGYIEESILQLLVVAGDSLLVEQRASNGAREVRWLRGWRGAL